MTISIKRALGALGAAALLGGCATGYYDDGYYGDRYAYGAPGYAYAPGYYYDPAPAVGLGFGYSYYDRGDRRHWRGDRHHDRRITRDDVARHNQDAINNTYGEPARNRDGTIQSERLGTDSRGTTYWQGSDGRLYEGTLPPGKNPTASGG